jgi:hypothetical protein
MGADDRCGRELLFVPGSQPVLNGLMSVMIVSLPPLLAPGRVVGWTGFIHGRFAD